MTLDLSQEIKCHFGDFSSMVGNALCDSGSHEISVSYGFHLVHTVVLKPKKKVHDFIELCRQIRILFLPAVK